MGSVQLDDLKPFCDHCVFQEMERITSPTAQAVRHPCVLGKQENMVKFPK